MNGRRSARGRLPLVLAMSVGLVLAACSRAEPGAATSTSPPTSTPPTTSTSASSKPPTPPLTPSLPLTPSPPSKPTPTSTPVTPPPTTAPTPTATSLPPTLLGIDVNRLPTSQRVVALTFDAGANADGVPKILATLRAEKVPATFFLTGSWARSFPQRAQDIGTQFAIGDHTMTHPHLNQLSDDVVRAEVEQARSVIHAATGVDPRPLFRFPFGEHNTHNRALVNALGYVSIGWTVDTLGWQGTSAGRTADTVKQRVLAGLQPGEVVLMHVGSNPTDHSTLDADALAATIEGIRAAGYGFVTVADALGLS